MKLTGIIEDVFRGVTIFRGYATLRTLAKLSASTSYQRDKDPDRITAITDYIAGSSYVFFPELILGWQLDNHDAIRKIKEEENTSSISLDNGIKIKKAKFRFKSLVSGEEPKTKVVTIEIPDTLNVTIFNRIDGNHRLSAIDKIREETGAYDNEICDQIVPFCLIIQNESDVAKKFESAYFYLINSKAKVLTTNENLKALLEENLFSNEEIVLLLSINKDKIYFIKELIDYLKFNTVNFVLDVFNSELYDFLYCILSNKMFMNLDYSRDNLNKVIQSIQLVNCYYLEGKIKVCSKEILLASVIVQYMEPRNFDKFIKWINENEIYKVDDLSCDNIINIFVNIHKQKTYNVFVAMPYISIKRVNDFNKLFKEILNDISKDVGFELHLIPIMRFRGESQRIDKRLIDCIKKCDIFIGDLSTVNDNVIFEIGLAEGCGKKILLIKAEEDTDQLLFDKAAQLEKDQNGNIKRIPFDMDKLQYIPYSSSGYYNCIKDIMRRNIPIIVDQLKKEMHV